MRRRCGNASIRSWPVYEDANDATRPLLQIIADQKLGDALGSQSMLSRWENWVGERPAAGWSMGMIKRSKMGMFKRSKMGMIKYPRLKFLLDKTISIAKYSGPCLT
jgi:hypothetical protein